MANDALRLEIKGLNELQRSMTQAVRELGGPKLVETMRDVTLLVQRRGRQNAPVDTGRLRSSITPEIRRIGPEVRGVVGSNVTYAPFQEFGWTTTSGTKVEGRHYLRRALEASQEYIMRKFKATIAVIMRKRS